MSHFFTQTHPAEFILMKYNLKTVYIMLKLTCCALSLPLLAVRNVKTHNSHTRLLGALESPARPEFKPEKEESQASVGHITDKPRRESFFALQVVELQIHERHPPHPHPSPLDLPHSQCGDEESEFQRLRAFLSCKISGHLGRIRLWGKCSQCFS